MVDGYVIQRGKKFYILFIIYKNFKEQEDHWWIKEGKRLMNDVWYLLVADSYLSQTNCKPLESNRVVNVICNSNLSLLHKIVDIAIVSPGSKSIAEFTLLTVTCKAL